MTTYKSKISFVTVLPLLVVILMLVGIAISYHIWDPLIAAVPIFLFVTYLNRTTAYTIAGTTLNVRCGFLINTDVDINKIKSITKTNSMLSAPAWSTDRIEINYNTYDSVVVSPPDKVQFIADLRAINPQINVSLKNKK